MYIFHNQIELFKWIMDNRPHVSEISGNPIPHLIDGNQQSWCFMHVLGKKAFPKFKLYYKNIVLALPEEHTLYDERTGEARKRPEFDWVFQLADILKQEYFQTDHYYKPCYIPQIQHRILC